MTDVRMEWNENENWKTASKQPKLPGARRMKEKNERCEKNERKMKDKDEHKQGSRTRTRIRSRTKADAETNNNDANKADDAADRVHLRVETKMTRRCVP